MADVPKVRDRTTPELVGRVATTYPGMETHTWNLYNTDYEALLASEPHYRLKNGSWSGGGPLYVYRKKVTHSSILDWRERPLGEFKDYVHQWRLGGVISAGPSWSNPLPSTPQSWLDRKSDLQPWYAAGRAKTQPGAPVADQALFVIELLREGVPGIPGVHNFYRKGGIFQQARSMRDIPKLALAQLVNFRTLGSEYLNIEFGWKPFLSDLRAMFTLQKEVDTAFAKLLKENGKGIHRKATLTSTTDVDVHQEKKAFSFSYLLSPIPKTVLHPTSYTRVRTIETNRWFAARYQYWIPDAYLGSWLWTTRAKLALMGVNPSPDLLWQALPWSWLADWFGNVDDIASLLSYTPAANLYTNYAFVMEHVRVHEERTAHVDFPAASNSRFEKTSHTFRTTELRETKCRSGGHYLFGLGITGGVATTRQLGILAALGFSRSRL